MSEVLIFQSIAVSTLYSSTRIGRKTCKEPLGYQVNLALTAHSSRNTGKFSLSDFLQPHKIASLVFTIFLHAEHPEGSCECYHSKDHDMVIQKHSENGYSQLPDWRLA